MFRQENAFRYTLYNKGLEGASSASTSEQRRLARQFEKNYGLSQDVAKALALIPDIQNQPELLNTADSSASWNKISLIGNWDTTCTI